MSITSLTATGSGAIRWRVAIAGLPYELVSHEDMETTLGGNERRICCLGPEAFTSIILAERVFPIDVLPEADSISIEVADTRERLSELFHKIPTKGTWMKIGMDASGTTLSVHNADGWAIGDYAFVNLETMEVTAVDTVNHELTVTRALWDTDARSHYVEGDGPELRSVEVTNWPRSITGRRVRIFWYGLGDSATGSGSLFWSGIVQREPEMSGAFWRLDFDPTTRILDQTLGTGLSDPVVPRGIKYDGAALEIELSLGNDDTSVGGPDLVAEVSLGLDEHAFFEDQEAFVAELNTRIAAAISGWTGNPKITAVAVGDSDWFFQVEIGSVARYIGVDATSPIDGTTMPGLLAEGEKLDTVTAGQLCTVDWWTTVPGMRSVPRGCYGRVGLRSRSREETPRTSTAPFANRIYVDGDIDLTGVLAVMVEWPAVGSLEETTQLHFVDSVSTANRSVDLRYARGSSGEFIQGRAYTSQLLPKIKIWRVYVQAGHVGDFVVALALDSVDETNRAGAPAISQYDVSISAWQAVGELLSGRPIHTLRQYTLGGEVDLGEMLMHECRLVGLFVAFSAQGALIPKLVRDFVETDPDITEIEIFETKDDRPTCAIQRLGTLRGAVIKSGYEPHTDEWEGPTFTILDAVANSRNPMAAMMDVKPRSTFPTSTMADAQNARDAEAGIAPLIAAFAYPYATYRVTTSLKHKNLLLGDGVRFATTGRWLPNPETGDRTPRTIAGQIMSRTVNPARGRVVFEVRSSIEGLVGYAPSAGVTTQSNVAGNVWDLTCALRDPWGVANWGEDEGDTLSTHFAAGYTCRLIEWAVAAPTEMECSINTVTDPGTIRVTTAGVWTPGSNRWVLEFDETTDAVTAQERYAWYADSERVIQFTTPKRARVFAG